MYVSRLRLKNYRNYDQLELSFDRESVFFLGRNGQGKTNLLESVFLCAAGRSHRTPRERELIQIGREEAQVKLQVMRREGPQTVDFRLYADGPRAVYVNAIRTRKIGELMGHFNCVLFAPEDLNLVKDGPAQRRRFLDMEISQLSATYFYALQRYAKALRQRNALLKTDLSARSLPVSLDAWDALLAESGAYIQKTRARYVQRLSLFAQERYGVLCGRQERLDLCYSPNMPPESADPAFYAQQLLSCRRQDMARKTTLWGVHRDDILLTLDGRDLRAYGSQGQQRTAAIALKLSELSLMHDQLGQWPVLLMDDVLSELDESRQQALLQSVGPVQCFFTGTDTWGLKGKAMRVVRIEGGNVLNASS